MKESLHIVKLGGKLIFEPDLLESFLQKFAQIPGNKILVHGGARVANAWFERLNIPPKMHRGRRITDENALDIVTMVYAGLLNKRVVSRLNALSCCAFGLSGADGNFIIAHKRILKDIDYGFAGDIDAVRIEVIDTLLTRGFTPIICPITHDRNGQLLNTNADTITRILGRELAKSYEVIIQYCFEYPGVLIDRNDGSRVFESLSGSQIDGLIDTGVLAEGMIPKIHNAILASQSGVGEVWICGIDNLIDKVNATIILG